MRSGTSRPSTRRRSREEIIELFRAGSAFKEGDLRKLTDALSSSPIRSANLLTASALMRLVEEGIRDRSKFSLGDFERQLFAHKIIET